MMPRMLTIIQISLRVVSSIFVSLDSELVSREPYDPICVVDFTPSDRRQICMWVDNTQRSPFSIFYVIESVQLLLARRCINDCTTLQFVIRVLHVSLHRGFVYTGCTIQVVVRSLHVSLYTYLKEIEKGMYVACVPLASSPGRFVSK